MSDLVPTEDIERIVGASRRQKMHIGRAVSSEQTVYILHSKECLHSGIDLRDCVFQVALNRGIDMDLWSGHEDCPVELAILGAGDLAPLWHVDDLVARLGRIAAKYEENHLADHARGVHHAIREARAFFT